MTETKKSILDLLLVIAIAVLATLIENVVYHFLVSEHRQYTCSYEQQSLGYCYNIEEQTNVTTTK